MKFYSVVLLGIRLASLACGQTPPLGVLEGASDIGTPAHKGSVQYDAEKMEYRITGGGANMWGVRDDFHFVWKKMEGDVAITANVRIVSEGNGHRKAGLILRQGLEPGAVYADAILHGDGLLALQWREKPGEITRTVHFPERAPTRIRIERRRNRIIVFAAKGDGPLVELADTELAPFSPVFVGMGVCAHDDQAETTAVFSNVKIEQLAPPAAPAKK